MGSPVERVEHPSFFGGSSSSYHFLSFFSSPPNILPPLPPSLSLSSFPLQTDSDTETKLNRPLLAAITHAAGAAFYSRNQSESRK